MNTLLFNTLLPEEIKNFILQVGDIGHTRVVGKDLERSQMNTGTNLDTRDVFLVQLIGQLHGILLRVLAKEVLIRNVNVGILKTILIREKVVDRRATLTQHLLVFQEPSNHQECLLEFGVGSCPAINDLRRNLRRFLNGFHYWMP